MTKEQIEAVLERVKTWPKERQQDAVDILLKMERMGTKIYRLSGEERADLEEARKEIERGEVASDEEVAAVFNKYRRRRLLIARAPSRS